MEVVQYNLTVRSRTDGIRVWKYSLACIEGVRCVGNAVSADGTNCLVVGVTNHGRHSDVGRTTDGSVGRFTDGTTGLSADGVVGRTTDSGVREAGSVAARRHLRGERVE